MSEFGERLLTDPGRKKTRGDILRSLSFILVPFLAILFQVYATRLFEFLKFLELPLLVTIYFALTRRQPIAGVLFGAAVGMAQDSLSQQLIGMYGIVKTLVGYFAASVGVRLDVDHGFIRLLLAFFLFEFHQIMFWVMERALLGHQPAFELQRWAVLGLLNAAVGLAVFHFLDRLRETA